MPCLENHTHEHVAQLVAGGKDPCEAYKLIKPFAKHPRQLAYSIAKREDFRMRVEELRSEVAMRSVLDISKKREMLRQMAEGIIPTKIIDKESGKHYDCLAALLADAKIAGDFAAEELHIRSSRDLKLIFEVPHRDAPVLEGEFSPVVPPALQDKAEEQPVDPLDSLVFDIELGGEVAETPEPQTTPAANAYRERSREDYD